VAPLPLATRQPSLSIPSRSLPPQPQRPPTALPPLPFPVSHNRPADPTTSSGGPNTATPTDQQPSFLLLPATRSGGEDEKPIEEPIYSEADLKEKRERQIQKP